MTIPNFIIWKTNHGPLLLSSPKTRLKKASRQKIFWKIMLKISWRTMNVEFLSKQPTLCDEKRKITQYKKLRIAPLMSFYERGVQN